MKRTSTTTRQENYSAPEIEEIIIGIQSSVLLDTSEPGGGGESGSDGGSL